MATLVSSVGLHKPNKKADVLKLQQLLNRTNGSKIKEDGEFGPKTMSAILAFQARSGLKRDGVVGKNGATIHRLSQDKNIRPTTIASKFSPLEYLAKTLYGEAGGQSYAEKVAVGWVIRNRVENGNKGATYGSIVTARKQFTCWDAVADPANYKRIMTPSGQAWEDSKLAAQEVIDTPEALNPLPGVKNYYSPKAQKALHAKFPDKYLADVPDWALKMQKVDNPLAIPEENFAFYKQKTK